MLQVSRVSVQGAGLTPSFCIYSGHVFYSQAIRAVIRSHFIRLNRTIESTIAVVISLQCIYSVFYRLFCPPYQPGGRPIGARFTRSISLSQPQPIYMQSNFRHVYTMHSFFSRGLSRLNNPLPVNFALASVSRSSRAPENPFNK